MDASYRYTARAIQILRKPLKICGNLKKLKETIALWMQ